MSLAREDLELLLPRIAHGILLTAQGKTTLSIRPENIINNIQLDISYTHEIPVPSTHPIWIQQNTPPRLPTTLSLYQEPSGWRLDINCLGRGAFLYQKNKIKIFWHPEGTDASHYLFGIGLAIWLELQGIPCLHGNSLATEDHAIALLGATQAGKSSLSAALLNNGFSFLSDDLIAPRQQDANWFAYPAPGFLRMWPASIQQFASSVDSTSLSRVHASSKKRLVPIEAIKSWRICQAPKPLKAIYLLNRDLTGANNNIHIETLKPADALITLIANSILAGALTPLDVEQTRLEHLTQMASKITIKHIHYPSGYQHLTAVQDAILEDIQVSTVS